MRRACLTVAVLATAVFTGWAAQPPALGASSGGQEAVTIASGVSKIARWELYARTPKPGRRCLGMRVEQLWDATAVARRERCGARRIAKGAVTLQTLAAPGMGSFAFGRARPRVGQVSVRVGDHAPATPGRSRARSAAEVASGSSTQASAARPFACRRWASQRQRAGEGAHGPDRASRLRLGHPPPPLGGAWAR